MKVVYILVSSDNDLYLEQLWVSLYSLRIYNPTVEVVLLMDDATVKTLESNRSKIREYINKEIVVDVPREYSSKERSRYIKTTFRKYLRGDLLFLDTDTVITGSLADIANLKCDVACVLDYHLPLSLSIYGETIRANIKRIFGKDVSDEIEYFNSGVMFLRDTEMVTQLFDDWHGYWKYSCFKRGLCLDQPSLFMANLKNNHIIKELDGCYNCQILTSIKFLNTAKIIHFFNNVWEGKEELSPFLKKDLYLDLKEAGELSSHLKVMIKNCKNEFMSPSMFVATKRIEFLDTMPGAIFYSLYKHNGWKWKIVNFVMNQIYNFSKKWLK